MLHYTDVNRTSYRWECGRRAFPATFFSEFQWAQFSLRFHPLQHSAVVAERLGFDENEALSLANGLAELTVPFKGGLGIFEPAKTKRIEMRRSCKNNYKLRSPL